MNRSPWRALLLALGLAGALAALHRAGGALPVSLSPTEPALVVVGAARWAALAAGWYLAVATVAGAAARLGRLGTVVRLTDRFTVPMLRRLLDTTVGLSVLAGVATAPAASAASADARAPAASADASPPPAEAGPPPTMLRLPDEPAERRPVSLPSPPTTDPPAGSSTTTSTVVAVPTSTTSVPPRPTSTVSWPAGAGNPPPTTTTTAVIPSRPPGSSSGARAEPSGPPPAPPDTHDTWTVQPSGPPPAPPDTHDTWTVQPGDHFWSIAEQALARSWQRPPRDRETDPYWRALVAANRDRLADRHNPDLLFVGQVLVLPAPPPRAPP